MIWDLVMVTLKVPSSFQMVSFTRLTTEIGPLIEIYVALLF